MLRMEEKSIIEEITRDNDNEWLDEEDDDVDKGSERWVPSEDLFTDLLLPNAFEENDE